jgi:AraC-like DNA-binding protein
VLCLAGGARYDDRHPIGPGDLFFRFAGVPHDLEITSAPWRECWISLGAPVERLLLATGLLDRAVPVRRVAVDAAWLDELAAGIPALEAAAERDLPFHLVRLQGLLVTLLRAQPEAGLDLDRACRLLAEPEPALSEVARRCGQDYDNFRREFRRRTGLAPGAWRTRRLLERACRGLLGGIAVQDLAAELGYASPFAFSAAFRRTLGVSPRAWRKAHR